VLPLAGPFSLSPRWFNRYARCSNNVDSSAVSRKRARQADQVNLPTAIICSLGVSRQLNCAAAIGESAAGGMINDQATHAIELAWESFCGHSPDTECAFFSRCRSAILIV
jgi:hypothetical protein